MNRRITYLVSALGLALTVFPASAAPKAWKFNFFSMVWSNPDNWDPPGVPLNGDDIHFLARPLFDGSRLSVNDLTNLTVRSLNFSVLVNDAPTTYEWFLTGNELTITHSLEAHHSQDEDVYIRCPLRLGGHAVFSAGPGSEIFPYIGLHLDSPIDLNGYNLRLVEDSEGGDLDITGAISGNGNIIAESGSAELTGETGNTFAGTVTVARWASLILNKSSGLAVPGNLLIETNGETKLNRPHQIADFATVTLRSGGKLRLQGNTETIFGLVLDHRAMPGFDLDPLEVDSGGATLSVVDGIRVRNDDGLVPVIKGQVGLPPGNHLIHTSGSSLFALNIEAAMIGDGGFTKAGEAGLMLGGDSSFHGDAILQEGRVDVNHQAALGSTSGATFLDGGELYLNGTAVGAETLFAERRTSRLPILGAVVNAVDTCSWAGPIILHTNLTIAGDDLILSGAITGSGGVRFLGINRVQLTGPEGNTYTGDTLAAGDLLELNKPSGVAAFGGRLVVDTGGSHPAEVRWLQNYQRVGAEVILASTANDPALINLNNHREDFGPVTFYGGVIDSGAAGELGLYGLVTVTPLGGEAIINGRVYLAPAHPGFQVEDAPRLADLVVNAVVAGAGHVRKTGLGQMWLNGSNSYAGLTVVREGSLVAFHDHALGGPSAGTSVHDGASLILNSPNSSVPEPISVAGAGDGAHGALNVFGAVTLRTPFPSIHACLELITNAVIRVEPGGVLTADGFISGSGPLTKTGPGTLVFANANTNSYSGETRVREGALYLGKPNFAVGIPGDLVIGPPPHGAIAVVRYDQSGAMYPNATVTVNAGSLLDLNGHGQTILRLNLNDGGDGQTGAGRLSFGLGGIIAVGSLHPLGSHASCSFSGNIGLPANAPLTFAVGAYAPSAPFDFNPELDVSAHIPAPGENPNFERAGLVKIGPGTLRLGGSSSFNGRADVMEGRLIAASSLALGSSSDGTVVINNATLALENSLNIENEVLALNSAAVPALENLSGDSYWSGPVILQRHSSVGARTNSALQLAGVISGAANFTKLGSGTLRFGGGDHNTYTGETFVEEGVLLLGKPIAVTAVPGPLSIGNSAGSRAMAANLAGYQVVGNVFVNRNGLLHLNGQEENVEHLWLTEGGDVQTGPGFLFLKPGGTIRALPGTHNDSSTIAGNLGLDPGPHDVIVEQGGNFLGAAELTVDAVVSQPLATAGLQKSGAGTLRLTADNTYAGETTINAGSLQVDGNLASASVIVRSGGRLMGHGRVNAIEFGTLTATPGVVAPGASPGILGCSDFNAGAAGGTLQIELNGRTAGVNGHDQLYARGPLNSVTLDNVRLNASLNFASAVDDQFMILRKDGFQPVNGEFTDLPEGARFHVGGEQFSITYFGGTGNDVVLTRIATGPQPVLMIQKLEPAAVRLVWPSSFTGYTLQFTTNLNEASWLPSLPLPAVTGTNQVVTNATSGERRFYRLVKP